MNYTALDGIKNARLRDCFPFTIAYYKLSHAMQPEAFQAF